MVRRGRYIGHLGIQYDLARFNPRASTDEYSHVWATKKYTWLCEGCLREYVSREEARRCELNHLAATIVG